MARDGVTSRTKGPPPPPATPRVTPAMQQYHRFKKQYPECVLFFRMGDFYEMFDADAVEMSKSLGLTLTQRTEGVPMAGVPYHQCDNYVRRALKAGYRIAVCDQVQDPKDAKGVVARAVTRVYTPGTLVDEGLVEDGATSCVAAVTFRGSGESAPAAAVVDLTSGRFVLFDLPEDAPADALADEFARFGVSEVVYPETADGKTPGRIERLVRTIGASPSGGASWHFRHEEALEALRAHFGVATLTGFGVEDDDPAIGAAGALLRHLERTQTPQLDRDLASDPTVRVPTPTLGHLRPPRRLERGVHLHLDQATLRSLEVLTTLRAGETDGSLLSVFGGAGSKGSCRAPMGKRLLREWLCRPLCEAGPIRARQRCVATLVEDRRAGEELAGILSKVHDVARIGARLALRRLSPRDLVALGRSLALIDGVIESIADAPAFAGYAESLGAVRGALAPLGERIATECVEEPPAHLRDGSDRLFRDGVDAELDEARGLQSSSADWLASYQERLIREHDLPNLKVGYNRVFGYFIELPAAQAKRAPHAFTRRQTLKNAERYITPELHEFEAKVSTAEARALAREQAMFEEFIGLAHAQLAQINAFGDVVAELDVLGAFASKASQRRWVRPEIVEDASVLRIAQGRHPVLDELLGTEFVPNDLDLGGEKDEDPSLALITGPNMAGKSTFIRQVALITLLAHTGSFVPADDAVVGLTDQIFTRVGADDALHRGQSTFMVEMTETARILHHATGRSLVILDEVGRGTSTLDGLSLAWAIAETLAGAPGSPKGPRTLFATHYHELTQLAERMPDRARNLHVAVQEWGDEVVFLHRILAGKTDRSYGIHVARLAGLPDETVRRASELLDSLAVHHGAPPLPAPDQQASGRGAKRSSKGNDQLSLFDAPAKPHPVIEELKGLEIDRMTPLDAFDALRALRGKVSGEAD